MPYVRRRVMGALTINAANYFIGSKGYKNATFIRSNEEGIEVGRPLARFPARDQVEPVTMPGTDHLTKVIDLSFAKRLTVVGAPVVNGQQAIGGANKTDSFSAGQQQPGTIDRQCRFHFADGGKDLYPVHPVVSERVPFFYLSFYR